MVSLHIAVLTDDVLFCDCILHVLREDAALEATAFEERTDLAATRTAHDIAILDARIDGVLTACASICIDGRPYVIFVGAPDEDAWAGQALTAGARGILTKTARVEDLVRAIRVVQGGGLWARPSWLNSRLQHLSASKPATLPHCKLDARLSRRERDVFHGAAMGVGNKELADRLAISEGTVKAHLTRIFQKLGITKRAELAAMYHGLLASDASPVTAPPPVR